LIADHARRCRPPTFHRGTTATDLDRRQSRGNRPGGARSPPFDQTAFFIEKRVGFITACSPNARHARTALVGDRRNLIPMLCRLPNGSPILIHFTGCRNLLVSLTIRESSVHQRKHEAGPNQHPNASGNDAQANALAHGDGRTEIAEFRMVAGRDRDVALRLRKIPCRTKRYG
jgi:hypothetical protein